MAFKAGEWTVCPDRNSLLRDDVEKHVEPKVMKVLLTLAFHKDRVVLKEELITAVWPDTFVGDDVLTRCISILRRITEDNPHKPHFIQTVPKVGYRLVADVTELEPEPEPSDRQVLESPVPLQFPALPPVGQPDTGLTSKGRSHVISVAVVALVLFAVTAGTSLFVSAKRNADTYPPFQILEFASYAGEQIQPAFSPDGTQIAFVSISEDGNSRRIYIKKIGTEVGRPLTSNTDEEFSPAWSPGGKQIAYLSKSASGLGLYLAHVDAKIPPRKLLIPQEPSHWEQGALSWSPDGKSLIFPDHTGSEPNSSIFKLDLATLQARSITFPPNGWEGDLNPAYSPDGTRIAFTRASETAVRDIYWISLTDGKLHQLTHDRMNIDSLAWTEDGKVIVFSSNRGGKNALWKIGLTDNQPQRLPVGTEDAFQPSVGPKAGQLAYSHGSAIWSIVRLQEQGTGKAAVAPAMLLSSTQQDSAPTLSPDGRFFAIQSLRSGSQEIWIASAGGDSLRQLTFMGGPLTGSPSWSNHGNQITFDSRPDGHSHVFLIPTAGGHPRQLTFGNANDIVPRWSHDDRMIYFRSNRGGRWQLWKVSTSGGDPQPVTTGDGISPQESEDGTWLYFTRGDEDGLWRMPTAGGPETQILKQPSAGYWGYWQVTPHGIFYLDRSRPVTAVSILNPESLRTTIFTTLKQSPPPYSGISVADNGTNLLMTDERDAGRHITLVEARP